MHSTGSNTRCDIIDLRKKAEVNLYNVNLVEPTEEQFLIVNALETLELLQWRLYDQETGYWRIHTLSPVLPIAIILQNGEIVPPNWMSE